MATIRFSFAKLNGLAHFMFFARIRCAQWQDDVELAARQVDLVIPRAFHIDVSTVYFDDPLGECQAQAGAPALEARPACGMFSQFTGLKKLRKDNLVVIRMHPDARIADNDLNAAIW